MSATGEAKLSASRVPQSLPLLPRNVLLGFLHGYRATISHTYGDVCKYYPSCSAYAVGSVQQHGALKGSIMAAARIARCHPWAEGGIDDVPLKPRYRYELTRHGFVVPTARKD
ncbi:membrane protein insertion efficiency factor YidD [Microbacterium endophyticum]|uniref:membrane protein insertion efficiency factor YidD n=1 Tax=Microbacterium endophyticum TaxID=1526412 RepID=UPI001F493964|nr:membrane protein insertion efficiency factor YidD [Microbacterium endophyticum]